MLLNFSERNHARSSSKHARICLVGCLGFIPFPRVLVLCEMQSVSFRIWTCVAVSISNDDNHYTTGTSTFNHYKCWVLSSQVQSWIIYLGTWIFIPAFEKIQNISLFVHCHVGQLNQWKNLKFLHMWSHIIFSDITNFFSSDGQTNMHIAPAYLGFWDHQIKLVQDIYMIKISGKVNKSKHLQWV